MNKRYSVEEYYYKIYNESTNNELNSHYCDENNPLKLVLIQFIESFRRIYNNIVKNSEKNKMKLWSIRI